MNYHLEITNKINEIVLSKKEISVDKIDDYKKNLIDFVSRINDILNNITDSSLKEEKNNYNKLVDKFYEFYEEIIKAEYLLKLRKQNGCVIRGKTEIRKLSQNRFKEKVSNKTTVELFIDKKSILKSDNKLTKLRSIIIREKDNNITDKSYNKAAKKYKQESNNGAKKRYKLLKSELNEIMRSGIIALDVDVACERWIELISMIGSNGVSYKLGYSQRQQVIYDAYSYFNTMYSKGKLSSDKYDMYLNKLAVVSRYTKTGKTYFFKDDSGINELYEFNTESVLANVNYYDAESVLTDDIDATIVKK